VGKLIYSIIGVPDAPQARLLDYIIIQPKGDLFLAYTKRGNMRRSEPEGSIKEKAGL